MQREESAASLSSCSFILLTVEVMGGEAEEEEEEEVRCLDVQALPWFGSSEPGDLSCPLRHKQGCLIG